MFDGILPEAGTALRQAAEFINGSTQDTHVDPTRDSIGSA
jgi:hypothetical protein